MKSFKYLAVYFFIMLLIPKALSYFELNKEIYIYITYVAAFLFSCKYVKRSVTIPISIFFYLILFGVDLVADINFITSDKTESFVFGIGASLIFVCPMIVSVLVRRSIENVTSASS